MRTPKYTKVMKEGKYGDYIKHEKEDIGYDEELNTGIGHLHEK